MIKTRFAPSPTGYLHIGGLRTALYAYLLAKHSNGHFILRIEDTDQSRLVEGATENILKTLNWFGITPDEGPKAGGPNGPYIQSQRLEKYRAAAEKLIKEGKAYRCFCTKERLDELREFQKQNKMAPMYDRQCRYLSEAEIQEKLDAGIPYVIRQAIPLNQTVKFHDHVRGKMKFDTNTLDDHVLMKTDGFPTYHLAVAVDDIDMGITHIIRGEEWLPSAPKHILLFEALGHKAPEMAHLPLILNKDGSKLSKRQNDVAAEDYINKGYSKEALINFVSLLGWNNKDNQELYLIEELIEKFNIDNVQKAGAVLDIDKLNWFDWQHRRIKHLKKIKEIATSLDPSVKIEEARKGHLHFYFEENSKNQEFIIKKGQLLYSYLPESVAKEIPNHLLDSEFLFKALNSLEDKILREPKDFKEYSDFYFNFVEKPNLLLFLNPKMGVDHELSQEVLNKVLQELTESDFETPETLKRKFVKIIGLLELKNGQVLWPVRSALSNTQYSPGVFDLAYTLGFTETIKRLTKTMQELILHN